MKKLTLDYLYYNYEETLSILRVVFSYEISNGYEVVILAPIIGLN